MCRIFDALLCLSLSNSTFRPRFSLKFVSTRSDFALVYDYFSMMLVYDCSAKANAHSCTHHHACVERQYGLALARAACEECLSVKTSVVEYCDDNEEDCGKPNQRPVFKALISAHGSDYTNS